MEELNEKVTELRTKYRSIFKDSVKSLDELISKLKPKPVAGELLDEYPKNSDGQKWQQAVLELLQGEVSKNIYRKLNEILAYRTQFKCVGCATCCNLACSEFSPEELKQKAANGDKFATQFTSIFVPYASKEEARKIYPEYIKLLEDNGEDKVYFYHCPKLTEDKRCSDYENRPQICRDFPDNPLSFLPASCGYKAWKNEIEPIALMLHSMIEIIDFYISKLNKLLS